MMNIAWRDSVEEKFCEVSSEECVRDELIQKLWTVGCTDGGKTKTLACGRYGELFCIHVGGTTGSIQSWWYGGGDVMGALAVLAQQCHDELGWRINTLRECHAIIQALRSAVLAIQCIGKRSCSTDQSISCEQTAQKLISTASNVVARMKHISRGGESVDARAIPLTPTVQERPSSPVSIPASTRVLKAPSTNPFIGSQTASRKGLLASEPSVLLPYGSSL